MTRTVEDAALVLRVVSGYDPKDLTSSRAPISDYFAALREGVKGLKIGIPRSYIQFSDLDDQINMEMLVSLVSDVERMAQGIPASLPNP